jgi:hypothetical protein
MHLDEIGSVDGKWSELTQDHVMCFGTFKFCYETGSEDGRWMELAHDRVQWRALVLAVWSL